MAEGTLEELLGSAEHFNLNELEVVDQPTSLVEVLNNLAAEMIRCLQATIDKDNLIYKGNLRDKMRMPVKLFGTTLVAELYLEDYYKYMDQGVKGVTTFKDGSNNPRATLKAPNSPYKFTKGPKVEYIREWAQSKGLNEYAVRNIIAFQGLKPRFFYTNCVEETFTGAIWDKYLKDFSTVTGKNITKQFKKGFKKK